jgi:hypothetical protein
MRKVDRVHLLLDRNSRSADRSIGFSLHHMYLAFSLTPQKYAPVVVVSLRSRSALFSIYVLDMCTLQSMRNSSVVTPLRRCALS